MNESKKFKSMRVAMGLMVMTLVTSCVVGSTYAKYTVIGRQESAARVAKFGVTISADENTGFSDTYETNSKVTVCSARGNEKGGMVVAPGTSGELDRISISGTPEVSIRVEYQGGFAATFWEVSDGNGGTQFYCPIKITVKSDKESETVIEGVNFIGKQQEFEDKVNEAIEACSGDYDIQTLSGDISQYINVPIISWEWAFENGETPEEKNKYNKYDTELAGKEEKPALICIAFTATITQID